MQQIQRNYIPPISRVHNGVEENDLAPAEMLRVHLRLTQAGTTVPAPTPRSSGSLTLEEADAFALSPLPFVPPDLFLRLPGS